MMFDEREGNYNNLYFSELVFEIFCSILLPSGGNLGSSRRLLKLLYYFRQLTEK